MTDDVQTVMDGVGSKRAVIFSSFENTSLVMLFAATHPERCAALVLVDPWVTWTATDETPWMTDEQEWGRTIDHLRADWGTPRWSPMQDAQEQDWYVRYLCSSIYRFCVV